MSAHAMTALTGGILLPESVLTSWWFMLLAAIVAFNTIIYVGLTLGKLIPLPHQFHPSQVRGLLRSAGADIDQDSAVDDIPARAEPETDDSYENLRRGIARRDIPQAFALVGGLIVLLSVAALIAFRESRITYTLAELAAGMVFLVTEDVNLVETVSDLY